MNLNMYDSRPIADRLVRKRAQRLRRRRYLSLTERAPEWQLQHRDENQALLRALHQMEGKHVRLVADFENFRKRANRDRQHLMLTANEELVRELLHVVDNFERALAAVRVATDVNVIASGTEMIYKNLLTVLQSAGLQPINTENAFFDPHLHEALSTDERADLENNRITQELLRGYLFRGRVLRPALVKVNKVKYEKQEARGGTQAGMRSAVEE